MATIDFAGPATIAIERTGSKREQTQPRDSTIPTYSILACHNGPVKLSARREFLTFWCYVALRHNRTFLQMLTNALNKLTCVKMVDVSTSLADINAYVIQDLFLLMTRLHASVSLFVTTESLWFCSACQYRLPGRFRHVPSRLSCDYERARACVSACVKLMPLCLLLC